MGELENFQVLKGGKLVTTVEVDTASNSALGLAGHVLGQLFPEHSKLLEEISDKEGEPAKSINAISNELVKRLQVKLNVVVKLDWITKQPNKTWQSGEEFYEDQTCMECLRGMNRWIEATFFEKSKM